MKFGFLVSLLFLLIVCVLGLSPAAFDVSNQQTANPISIDRIPATDSLATPAEKPVILHISIIDHTAFSVSAINETDRFLKIALPGSRLISVKATTSRFLSNPEKVRASVLKQLRKRTDSNDRITHLVIDTHGNTRRDYVTNESYTNLKYLGEFTESKVNDDLATILEPVRGLFTHDAKVILNSCLTFCGESPEVAARAKTLLRYLGINNGQIYGAITIEKDLVGGYVRKGTMWRALTDLGQLKFFMTAATALGVPLAYALQDQSYLSAAGIAEFAATSGVSTAILGAMIHASMQVIKRIGAHDKSINKGRLVVFRNGEVVSNTRARKYDDKLQIYGAQCSAAFANL